MGQNLSDMLGGGGNGGGNNFNRVPIRPTTEQRQGDFLTDFFKRFGGGGGESFGNPNYRESLEGYFNKPFAEIGGQLSKVNTFMPKNPAPYGYKTIMKQNKDNGSGGFGMPMGGSNQGMGMPMMQPDMLGLNLF